MGDDERREDAIAATPALQPNFQSPSVSQNQIEKLKELHNRRLQIKAKSKIQKNLKGNASGAAKSHEKKLSVNGRKDEQTTAMLEDSSISTAKDNTCLKDLDQVPQVPPTSALKKRQKLHWGLDTKERWERKANM